MLNNILFPRSFLSDELKLSEGEWTSVLVLASRWEMTRLQTLAIDKLTPCFESDPHKLIVLGRRHGINPWLTSGIQLLVLRKQPMDENDANVIGPCASLKVSALREWTLQWKISHRDSTEWILNRRDTPPERDTLKRIRDAFGLPDPE